VGRCFACGCLPSPIYGRGAGERASVSRRDGLDLNRRALSPSPSPAGGRGEQTVGRCFACGCLPSPIYGRGAGERASASRRDGLDLNRRARSPSPSPAGGRGEQTVGLFGRWLSPLSHLWERGGGEGERLKTRRPRFEPPCPLPQSLSRRRERGADRGGAVLPVVVSRLPFMGEGRGRGRASQDAMASI